MSKSYIEKLRDPRWQKKRLEILQRDNWACHSCGDTENTLHVHHLRYFKGRNPWDYDNSLLMTLCANCHELEGDLRKDYEHDLLEMLKEKAFLYFDVARLASGINQMELQHVPEVIASAYSFAFADPQMQKYIIERYFTALEEFNKTKRK